jgi:hypothetical protein
MEEKGAWKEGIWGKRGHPGKGGGTERETGFWRRKEAPWGTQGENGRPGRVELRGRAGGKEQGALGREGRTEEWSIWKTKGPLSGRTGPQGREGSFQDSREDTCVGGLRARGSALGRKVGIRGASTHFLSIPSPISASAQLEDSGHRQLGDGRVWFLIS